jgi:YVTN family beta-propeller protein
LISGPGAGPNAGDISLVVMGASSRKEVKQLNLGGGAAGILVAPHGLRAYVAVSTNDKVAAVDWNSLEVVGQISAGKQPDGLAWAVRK